MLCTWLLRKNIHDEIQLMQCKFEGFDRCDRPSNLTQFGFKLLIFSPYIWLWNWMDDLEKLYGTSSKQRQALCIFSRPSVNSNWSYSPETLNSAQNCRHFVMCDLETWWMTLKSNLFYATSSFAHHFIITGEFKLELHFGNAPFGSKSAFYCPCDPEIWRMTLKNNRTPLLCYFKLGVSFHSRRWIQVLIHPDWLVPGRISSRWLMTNAGCHPDDLGCCVLSCGWHNMIWTLSHLGELVPLQISSGWLMANAECHPVDLDVALCPADDIT